MPLNEFWYGEISLLKAYEKAYYRNATYMAWVQGDYFMVAVEKAVRNSLAMKKEQIDRKWIDYVDPIDRLLNQKTEKDNKVEQQNQEEWFFNLFNE